MASVSQLKTRIRSVKSTKQITKAMQLVAASKMRRAIEATGATADYAAAARELMTHLATEFVTLDHPLFAKRPVRNRLLIVVSSDTGLAGAYNANILKLYANELRKDADNNIGSQTLALGRKISQFAVRIEGVKLAGAYENLPDRPTGVELRTILTDALNAFTSGEVDQVDLIFTEFKSTISQEAVCRTLLPLSRIEDIEVSQEIRESVFEPSPHEVLEAVLERMIGAQIYQALLDSRASEHSMRMMAMKNATDNASGLVDDLTLAMNKERQAAITQELAEISSGAEAVEG